MDYFTELEVLNPRLMGIALTPVSSSCVVNACARALSAERQGDSMEYTRTRVRIVVRGVNPVI